jgi:hypothetical protein
MQVFATPLCGLFLTCRGKNKQLEIAAIVYAYILYRSSLQINATNVIFVVNATT